MTFAVWLQGVKELGKLHGGHLRRKNNNHNNDNHHYLLHLPLLPATFIPFAHTDA